MRIALSPGAKPRDRVISRHSPLPLNGSTRVRRSTVNVPTARARSASASCMQSSYPMNSRPNMARIVTFALLLSALCAAQPTQKPLPEAERTQWFRDAKFGMFIHWGAYSVIGRHEWARHRFQIPQAEYDTYVRKFNPVNYNPDAWVDLAKNAGVKYMVITSKHHDGFSIFRSSLSDYDMKLTPYKGDPLKMLADSCRRKGMRLGFYHSIMDWRHPDYTPKRAWEVANPKEGGNLNRYIDFMKAQIRELLTGYGDVAM